MSAKVTNYKRISQEEPIPSNVSPQKPTMKCKSMYEVGSSQKSDDMLWQEWCMGQMPIVHTKKDQPKDLFECMSPTSIEERNSLYEWCTGMRLSMESTDSN